MMTISRQTIGVNRLLVAKIEELVLLYNA